ncbi:MAG: alpha/beta hydrolase [Rhodobacteraceae bacterium]|nr:alpha/beta hydrolase [Paracoccaceae bacterium]
MFTGFDSHRIKTRDTEIFLRLAGSGPPLLLLHGYPQTHVIWHKIAPALAERFTVILPDLRGYGDSGKPASDAAHSPYSKRAMAQDMVEVMEQLGFDRFSLVGHDRGARVAHRLARDHPKRLEKLALLDIAPTLHMYDATDMRFARAYYHWFFLIQPAGFPEKLIGEDPRFYLETSLGTWGKAGEAISPEAFAQYLRCFSDPATIHATCEDYRASAGIDLEHDRAETEKLAVPLLVLWGAEGFVGAAYDVLATWREVAQSVRGHAVPGGHFLPEESPDETLSALLDFL